MTQTLMNDDTLNELPALDLDAVRPALLQLARTTVDKTLQQARASGSDPVLGCSSALATFYMMMPRNDGKCPGAHPSTLSPCMSKRSDGDYGKSQSFGIDRSILIGRSNQYRRSWQDSIRIKLPNPRGPS